jgi:hypothetical protein
LLDCLQDVGIEQGGVVEALEQAIMALPIDLREPACQVTTGRSSLRPEPAQHWLRFAYTVVRTGAC